MVIKDDEYIDYMTNTVEPYLKERLTVEYPEREKGNKIYCEYYESGEENIKGIVVISHGFTDTAEKFHEEAWEFLTNGYNVCIPEHCGHGRSYRLIENDLSLIHVDTYLRYVEDLSFIAKTALRRWERLPLYLYAHSMGGGIGADLIGREPKLFDKAVLSSPMIKPLTAGIPWTATKIISGMFCSIGKGKNYIMGQHPYADDEVFETSAKTSRERFEYYNEKKRVTPLFQMSAASYSWIREATRLNSDIMKNAVKKTICPVLLFQSESDNFVSKDEQTKYVEELKKYHSNPDDAKLIAVAGTKHEIHNSTADILEIYWKEIFTFLE